MKFCWVTLYVKDMKASVDFYKEIVGLEILRTFSMGEERHFTFLGSGETQVELIQDSEVKEIVMGSTTSLGFEVDSVEDKIKFIKDKGLDVHSGPFSPNPSMKFFYILDPDGLKIQFVENIK